MSFISSILLGSEGSYSVLGQKVTFKNNIFSSEPAANPNLKLDNKGLNNSIFKIISFNFAHELIHELGHALSNRLFTGKNSEIFIDTTGRSSREGSTTAAACCPGLADLSTWKISMVFAAGPITNMAFSLGKLALLNALKVYVAWPIVVLLTISTISIMAQEILYAYNSVKKEDSGDFASISKNSSYHLIIASSILISQAALGILLFKSNIRLPTYTSL